MKKGKTGGKPKKGAVLMASVIGSTDPVKTPYEEKNKNRYKNISWIPFGANNLFPQEVSKLGRQSAPHRSIMNFKTIYVSGNSITVDDKQPQLAEYIKGVNNQNESLKDVTDKIFTDYNAGGNGYIELVKDNAASFMNMFHRDWNTARYKKPTYNLTTGERLGVPAILFHADWENINSTKKDIVEIPLYPNWVEDGNVQRSILHFKSYEPEFTYYGVADWISALDPATIAYKTNKWNLSRLDNGFAASGVITIDGDLSEDDSKELDTKFKKKFTGEGNQGKLLLIAKALGGGGTTFTPITTTAEGDWTQLHRQSTDDLLMAHGWSSYLSGRAEAGKLGSAQEIRNAYQIVHNTTVPYTRAKVMPLIQRVIMEMLKFDTSSMQITNVPSLDLMDLLNANKFTKIWEARKFAGLDYNMDDPQQQMYVDEAKTDTANGTTNIT